jgi:hypothetical protein
MIPNPTSTSTLSVPIATECPQSVDEVDLFEYATDKPVADGGDMKFVSTHSENACEEQSTTTSETKNSTDETPPQLEDLVRLLKNQISNSDWLTKNPPKGDPLW